MHPSGVDGMQRASQENTEWKRHKEVTVPWATYDAHRLNECKRVIDLRKAFVELDQPVQRREFQTLSTHNPPPVKTHARYLLSNTSKCYKRFVPLSGTGHETSTMLQNHSEHHAVSY